MAENVTGNGSAESYSAAVREAGGVWKNGNGNGADQLDAGVATLKAQLQAFQQAKATQQQFAIARCGERQRSESAAK
jgi:hypothetical protein